MPLSPVQRVTLPDAVEPRPARDAAVDVGAVLYDQRVARIDDGRMRALLRSVGEQVLDVRAHAELRRLESCAAHAAARRAEAAEIILARHDVATVGEEARFLQRLAERDVGPDALAARFFVVVAHDVGDGAVQLRARVAPRDVGGHLFLRRLGRAEDRDGLGRRVLGQQQFVIGWRQTPLYAFDGLLVELARQLRAKVGACNRDVACNRAFGDFRDGGSGRRKG